MCVRLTASSMCERARACVHSGKHKVVGLSPEGPARQSGKIGLRWHFCALHTCVHGSM